MKYFLSIVLFLFFTSCGNKTKEVEAEIQAEAARVNEFTEKLMKGEAPDDFVEYDTSYLWEKGYLKDEFDEEVKSSPYIKSYFYGKGDRGDAKLEICFSKTYGVIFRVFGGYYDDFADCEIKAKLGDNVLPLIPTDVDGSAIVFQDMEQIHTIIGLLECKDIFKLSILMKTGYTDMNSSFLFSIYGNKDVKKALASIGIELGYDGNYDYHGEAPDEDDYYDPTTLDQETLQNRVYDEE